MPDPRDSSATPAETPPFEDALGRLEELVALLERGDLRLEESLAAFEEGVRLVRQCAEELRRADRRIEELVKQGGEWLRRPFEVSEEGA
jgi:exodeoxyribonuclease VII small subunit